MNNKRKKAEELIYRVFDAVDTTHTNSDYYKKLFATMNDNEFLEFCKRRLPFRFHTDAFNVEPQSYEISDAFKVLGKPLFEKVNLPHYYVNKDGIPVQSQDSLVIYVHIKRMKQMGVLKTHTSANIDKRDMKTGLLTSDKGGKETDREFETLAVAGLDYTMDEFARVKGDAMAAMSQMSNVIMSKGSVSDKDITVAKDDSLGKNLVNVYFMGAMLETNLVNIDYMTPLTAKNRQRKNQVERDVQ